MRNPKPNQPGAKHSNTPLRSSSPHELPIVQSGENLLIDARLLHQNLKSRQQFSNWIRKRIEEYGFKEGEDYLINLFKSRTKPTREFHLTLDMAKELAMIERNEVGKAIRRYFIRKEKETRVMQLSPGEDLLKGMKPLNINGRVLYLFREVLRRTGHSTRTGYSDKVKRYFAHFIKIGSRLYVTEEFAHHLWHSRAVYVNRAKMKASQPILPLDFGDTSMLKGGK